MEQRELKRIADTMEMIATETAYIQEKRRKFNEGFVMPTEAFKSFFKHVNRWTPEAKGFEWTKDKAHKFFCYHYKRETGDDLDPAKSMDIFIRIMSKNKMMGFEFEGVEYVTANPPGERYHEKKKSAESLYHFSELSKEQMQGMSNACIDAAIDYAGKIRMSGLSDAHHDIYAALQEAITEEWEKSKQSMKDSQ